MTTGKPCRSALYMPAVNDRAVAKSRGLPADCLILDLEDSVAPEWKAQARQKAADALGARGFGAKTVVIRVNALDTPFAAEDIRAVAPQGPDAILLPKISHPGTIAEASDLLTAAGAPATTRLWVMIETPRAILNLREIAQAGGRLAGFVLGANDLAKDLRLPGANPRAFLAASLELTVLAARAADLTVLDGVYNAIADLSGFEAECADARARGFDGKTLIHPSQIEACNRIFAPSAESLAEARAIIAAFAAPAAQGKGAIQFKGRMIERLHLAEAERLVALWQAIAPETKG